MPFRMVGLELGGPNEESMPDSNGNEDPLLTLKRCVLRLKLTTRWGERPCLHCIVQGDGLYVELTTCPRSWRLAAAPEPFLAGLEIAE
jgi:hypothetical protein